MLLISLQSAVSPFCFTPPAHKGRQGIVFAHSADGRAGSGKNLAISGYISETVRCRKLILGRDIS